MSQQRYFDRLLDRGVGSAFSILQVHFLSRCSGYKRFTFQQVLQHCVGLGPFSSSASIAFPEVPGANSDRALANVIVSFCSAAHVKASSNAGKRE